MGKIRIDLYSGYATERNAIEKDTFVQLDGETTEDLIERVTNRLFDNCETLTLEDEGEDE